MKVSSVSNKKKRHGVKDIRVSQYIPQSKVLLTKIKEFAKIGTR